MTDDAAGEHVLAVADVTGIGIGGRARKTDAIQVRKAANARTVPADTGIIQHHAADAAFAGGESVLLAAVGAWHQNMSGAFRRCRGAARRGVDPDCRNHRRPGVAFAWAGG